MIGVTDLIAGIFKPAAELVDSLHTSDEERLDAKSRLLDVQAAAMQQVFTYEASILESQARIVNSEAKSEHWVTATWRPIAMLTFLALAVGDSLGLLATPLRDEAWTLLQIGLGGYVVGRSGEKVMKTLKDSK
tara:strand:+ start:131 stop:529 length:399 start_codon:yes stop_codon:yes gene_type:complete